MYIERYLVRNLQSLIGPQKVIVIYGPRQCGKTTLLKRYLETVQERRLFVTGDDIAVRSYLGSQSAAKLKDFVGEVKLLAIDEAQRIEKIGLNLKLIVDTIPDIKIIATGSSSFELAKDMGEPLAGRKFTLKLFPIAQMELSPIESRDQTASNLDSRLIFGSYPEILTSGDNRRREILLKEIVDGALFKDVLSMEGVRHSDKLLRLLQLVGFQIGRDISYNELATQLGMSKNTVDRYLDLLEKSFVLVRLGGFSRNLRKEITKSSRYFFYDNGIRNALIGNFNPLEMRNDIGMLWENYLVVERMKKQEYLQTLCNNYFWRTYDRKEIDLVEEREGKLFGYEMRYGNAGGHPPRDWIEAYPNAGYEIITRENYLTFIG